MPIIDPAQLTHQLRKDLMRTYGMLAAFGIIALASIALSAKLYGTAPAPCVNGCNNNPTWMLEFGIGGCLTLLLAITSVTLVQDDAPIDANAFWVSQPLRVRSLLLSKVLLTLVYFLVITTVVQLATIKVNGLSVRGSFAIVAISVYWYASLILMSMLVAAVTRGIQSAVLVGVGLLVMRVLVAGGVFELSPRLAQWMAEVGGIRGEVWIALALGVITWTYAAKSVRSRNKVVVTSVAIVGLGAMWNPGLKTQSHYLTLSPQSANTSLPSPSITAEFKKGALISDDQLVLTLVTPPPRAGYRYRLAQYAVDIQSAGSAGPPTKILDVMGAPVFVDANTKGDSARLENRVSAKLYIRLHDRIPGVRSIRAGTATLTVSGFLVEERLFDFANTPVRAGQSTRYGHSRFTIRSLSADSMAPQIAFDEISGGAEAQYGRPFVDGRVFVTSTPQYELYDATPETWVRFHGGQDSLRLVNINAMQCYAFVAIPSSGIRRSCGSMRAIGDSIKGVRGNPDWLQNGELFMTLWRYSSHASIRLELPLRAKN